MQTNNYTTPKLVKGKENTPIPKGSNKSIEQAKNVWYIEYRFNGKQIRISPNNLNRIKDPKEKQYKADIELQTIKQQLLDGYNPLNPNEYIEKILIENISLNDALTKYLEYFTKFNNRESSIGTYTSKLKYLNEFYPNKQLKKLTTKDIENYIHYKIHSKDKAVVELNGKKYECKNARPWTANTVKSARRIFSAFLNWCVKEDYISINPASKLDAKKIRSEVEPKDTNVPFNQFDLNRLTTYLTENDSYLAFFTQFMFSTLLRPKELSNLKLKDIELISKTIRVPLDVTKNTKKTEIQIIDIEDNLYNELLKLNLDQYPKDYYLTGDLIKIVGSESIGNNRPYKRCVTALKKLNLNGKGYTLYSFKHTSNIMRLNNGWTLAEIMKANRHSSIAMTEKYLKKINRITDISKKAIPKIY